MGGAVSRIACRNNMSLAIRKGRRAWYEKQKIEIYNLDKEELYNIISVGMKIVIMPNIASNCSTKRRKTDA